LRRPLLLGDDVGAGLREAALRLGG
jgi:hypothetical protein